MKVLKRKQDEAKLNQQSLACSLQNRAHIGCGSGQIDFSLKKNELTSLIRVNVRIPDKPRMLKLLMFSWTEHFYVCDLLTSNLVTACEGLIWASL